MCAYNKRWTSPGSTHALSRAEVCKYVVTTRTPAGVRVELTATGGHCVLPLTQNQSGTSSGWISEELPPCCRLPLNGWPATAVSRLGSFQDLTKNCQEGALCNVKKNKQTMGIKMAMKCILIDGNQCNYQIKQCVPSHHPSRSYRLAELTSM